MLLESPCLDAVGNGNDGHKHPDDYDDGPIAALPPCPRHEVFPPDWRGGFFFWPC